MSMYKKWDFVLCDKSKYAGPIINMNRRHYLISIHEFTGDYIWIEKDKIKCVNLSLEEKLSILANFGEWFYDEHKDLYNELIISYLSEIKNYLS